MKLLMKDMINAKNYFQQIDKITTNKLPDALRKAHELVVKTTNSGDDWDRYHNNETIKRVVNQYFEKLDQYLKTNEKKISKIEPESDAKSVKQVFKNIKPKKESKKIAKPRNSKEMSRSSKISSSKKVEHIREEIKFIKRFVSLHNKIKTPANILSFIKSLQRSIVQKLIRKASPYAKEIQSIQDRLVNTYNSMKAPAKIEIGDKELSKLVAIAGGEEVYPSINIMKRYIGLQGKQAEPKKTELLIRQIENALKKKKVKENDPYLDKVTAIYNTLKKLKSGSVVSMSKADLNGLEGIVKACGCKNDLGRIYYTRGKKLRQCKKKTYSDARKGACSHNQGLNGVLTAEQMATRQFDLLNFTSIWLSLFGRIAKNFTMMLHGEPHNGKTTFLLKFAQYLAENFGTVLYISSEEFASVTMTQKVNELLNPFPHRLHFAENLKDPVLSNYDFIILDSVNDLGLKIDDYRTMREANPGAAFILILQHTKDGKFKGGKDWEHKVEIVGEVVNGVVNITKNRYAPKASLDFFNYLNTQPQALMGTNNLPKSYLMNDAIMTTSDNNNY